MKTYDAAAAIEIQNFIDLTSGILFTINPMAEQCLTAGEQFGVAYYNYGVSFTTWDFLIYNVIYHLGYIYDLAVDMSEFFDGDWQETLDNTAAEVMGRLFGSIIRYTFKDLDDFEYPMETWN